jgi:cytochrome c-type biogenesis protein CcmH/NrfG
LSQAGFVTALLGGDLSGGIAMQEKSVRLNPNNAQALRVLGQLYAYAGDKQSAIGYLERAYRLNPVS